MSERLSNYLSGQWQAGTAAGSALFDPVLGNELVNVDATGLDLKAGFEFARRLGGSALRTMTYAQRGVMLTLRSVPTTPKCLALSPR
jgi:3,4-dehydroadipyl-CoA semialdehyde dehydrogenase